MLGSRADAEDAVQEAYLRWHGARTEEIRAPQAWLVTTITRLCIDRLRQLRAERERYTGQWLPEPLVEQAPPPADEAGLASNLSVALLAVLERLAPEERAAFLLREVFDVEYGDIAQILGKSEAACRQIVSRATKRVRARRPRVHVSRAATLARRARASRASARPTGAARAPRR
jgi:RNA polymerase sigma-70 factor (ECF subfamily)